MIELHNRIMASEADNGGAAKPLLLIQGESVGRKLTMTLLNGGTPLDLTAAAAVALYYTKPDGTEEQLPCTVEDAANGTVSVTFTSSSCTVAGDMRQVIIRITWSDASNSRYVGPRIHVAPSPSDDAADSSNEFALLDQLIIQAQEVIGDAEEAASAANTAAGAANTAANAANTAAGAANTAATDANAAKDAANTAAGAANTAAGAANTAADTANTAAGAANTAADRANQAAAGAENALPKTGGTITGNLEVEGNLTHQDSQVLDMASYPIDSGDWTPTVQAGSLSNVIAKWWRRGSLCHVILDATYTVDAGETSTASLDFYGLPFAVDASAGNVAGTAGRWIPIVLINGNADDPATGYSSLADGSRLRAICFRGNGRSYQVACKDMAGRSGEIALSIDYPIAGG